MNNQIITICILLLVNSQVVQASNTNSDPNASGMQSQTCGQNTRPVKPHPKAPINTSNGPITATK